MTRVAYDLTIRFWLDDHRELDPADLPGLLEVGEALLGILPDGLALNVDRLSITTEAIPTVSLHSRPMELENPSGDGP